MSIKAASLSVDEPSSALRGSISEALWVFLIAYVILFLGISLAPNIYDEGLVLTGAMRVAAGQIPHSDFYANYGPGQFYTLAGLFRVFGESLLVERLYDLFLKAFIATLVYKIALSYCRRPIAVCAASVTLLWFFGLNDMTCNPIVPVSLLNLVASVLILPVFLRPVSTKRMLAAGVVAGMAALFRYDTGIALLGVQAIVVAIAVFLRVSSMRDRLREFVSTFWPYLAGFAAITLPALFYYLRRAPLYPFVHDIFIYPGKYYHRARNLPFPRIDLTALDQIGIYLPIAIVGISIYLCVARRQRVHTSSSQEMQSNRLRGFLVTFGALALGMYLKGFVRVHLIHMYLSTLPSILLVAVLFQHREAFTRTISRAVTCLGCLMVVAAVFSDLKEARILYKGHASIPETAESLVRGSVPEIRSQWCEDKNPLTVGLCFFPDNDHIQAIEFIRSHTRPDQKLFVGLIRSDIIYANDNLIYFASQRLPATRWSHFDPYLQNTYEIQAQMIQEFEADTPPLIVLDSEFESIREQNDSSKSTGVTLLDEYIRKKYQQIETYGELSIWQRIRT